MGCEINGPLNSLSVKLHLLKQADDKSSISFI